MPPDLQPHKPFKVVPYAKGWDAGLNPTGFNRLIDELAVDDFLELQQRLDSTGAISKP